MYLGYAGTYPAHDPIHGHISSLTIGSELYLRDRLLVTTSGVVVGKLAKATQDFPGRQAKGIVKGIMVMMKSQSDPAFQNTIQTDKWETPLVEFD